MKRRDFLKLLGVSSATAVTTSCMESYHWVGTKSEKLIPYLVPPGEDHIPGEFVTLPSLCQECPTPCSAMARIAVKPPDPVEIVKNREIQTKRFFNIELASLSEKDKKNLLDSLNNELVSDSLVATFKKHGLYLKNPILKAKEKDKQWEILNGGYWENRYYLIRKGSQIQIHGIARKEWWNKVKEYWHGDPIKLEGNPANSLTQGKLCMRGQASLSRLYHEERLKSPIMKVKGKWQKVSWQIALNRIQEELKKNQAKKNLFLSAKTNGTLAKLQKDFCEKLNLELLPQFEAFSYANLKEAYQKVVGIGDIPFYHIENSDFLFTLGADLEDTFLNPVMHSRQIAQARQEKRWKWFHIEPTLSLTGLHSHRRWICRPRSESTLLAYLIHEWNEQNKASALSPKTILSEKILKNLPNPDKKKVLEETGLAESALEELLKAFKQAKKPLFIAGGPSLSHSQGLDTAILSVLFQWALGTMSGNASLVDFQKSYGYENVGSMKDVKGLIDSLNQEKVGVAFISRANLAPYLPRDWEFEKALSKASFTIGLDMMLHDTMKLCDLVLPLSHPLESFGDALSLKGVWTLTRPVVPPKFSTFEEGQVLLTLMGTKTGYHEYLAKEWTKLAKSTQTRLDESFWAKKGVIQENLASPSPKFSENAVVQILRDGKKNLAKSLKGKVLVIQPSLRFYDGRSMDLPILREIPDPLTTISYGEWISLSPALAKELGVEDGDEIQVTIGKETLVYPVRKQEGLAPNVLLFSFPSLALSKGAVQKDGLELTGVFEVSKIEKTGKHILLPILGTSKDPSGKDVLPETYVPVKAPTVKGKEHSASGEHGASGLKGRGNLMYEPHEYPDYKWAMAIDIEACNGCSACVAACYIENNVALSGPQEHLKGREMSWIRLEPYVIEEEGQESMEFVPMLCQQCDNAPCESVCPVLAAIHNSEGLNIQVYNRCVGTRYCANNCPYKVRRFNWFDWMGWPEEKILIDNSVIYGGMPLGNVINPAVSHRPRGVMEKCTFCIHRINQAKDRAKDEGRKVRDGEIIPACAETCPTDAIVFGNIQDKNSKVYQLSQEKGAHRILDHELNTKPSVYYLGKKG